MGAVKQSSTKDIPAPVIIGLSGGAGTGKDTVANILVEQHGFYKIAFADEIKRICQKLFQFTDEQLWGPSELRNKPDRRYRREGPEHPRFEQFPDGSGKCEVCRWDTDFKEEVICSGQPHESNESRYLTPRHALQTLGDWGRAQYKNVWVRLVMKETLRLHKVGLDPGTGRWLAGVVIPDCRFKDELDAVWGAEGKLVRVKSTFPTQQLLLPLAEHVTETEQLEVQDEDFDYVLTNEGDLGSLGEAVGTMMAELVI
jgi:hypothetical protein